jgi:hypothetical protein
MDERLRPDERAQDRAVKRPDEPAPGEAPLRDLEPEEKEGKNVTGGSFSWGATGTA